MCGRFKDWTGARCVLLWCQRDFGGQLAAIWEFSSCVCEPDLGELQLDAEIHAQRRSCQKTRKRSDVARNFSAFCGKLCPGENPFLPLHVGAQTPENEHFFLSYCKDKLVGKKRNAHGGCSVRNDKTPRTLTARNESRSARLVPWNHPKWRILVP